MIAAVLFDLDETLLDRTTSLRAFLADQYERFGGQLGTATSEVWIDRFLVLDARGSAHKSSVYPQILTAFGGDPALAQVLLADYRQRCCQHARAFPGMNDTLVALRARGCAMGLISNGETEFQRRHIQALRLGESLDVILVSESEGLRKPDVALFLRAAHRLNVVPAQCLFVGDDPVADILGAGAAGMRTAWFPNGRAWPRELAGPPGAVIRELSDVLTVIDELE
jgi:putative hydrolase of the HAD superfamily